MRRLVLDPNPAPGPGAPPPPPAPTGPPLSNVEQASIAARAALAQHGTALPAEAPAPDPAAAARAQAARERAQSTVRTDDGRLTGDRFREIPHADEEAREPGYRPAPSAGQAAPGEDPAPGEGEPPVPLEDPVDEDLGAVEPGPSGDEGDEEGITDARTVVIRGGRPDEEYELTFADERQANAIRHLQNRVQHLDALTERANRDLEQANQLRTEIEVDPAGFIVESLPQEPELLAHIVEYLATRPEVLPHLKRLFNSVGDREAFETLQLRVENDRFKLRDRFQSYSAETKQINENYRALNAAVVSLSPQGATQAQRNEFRTQCLRELQKYADRNNQLTIPVEDVPIILAQRLRAWGINPVEAVDRLTQDPARSGKPARLQARPAANGTPPAQTRGQPAVPGTGTPKTKTGKQFVQGQRVKRAAASIPGPGAGAPGSNDLTPPPNQTTEERVAWHRQQLAARRASITAGQRSA